MRKQREFLPNVAHGTIEARNDVHQCTFAGAVFTDNGQDFAVVDVEIDPIESDGLSETFVQAAEFQRCHRLRQVFVEWWMKQLLRFGRVEIVRCD